MSKKLSLSIFLVPVLTIFVSYLISASNGYVDWCIPIIEGCTSISKVGRHGLSFYLYKIFIIPSLILMIYFWSKTYLNIYKNVVLIFLSVVACLFLIIYLIALGFDGKIYRFMREIGIFVFFVLMPICQAWLTISTSHNFLNKFFLYLIIFIFIGLACVYLSILSLDNDNYENIIEWNFVFFIFLFFPVFYFSIKKSNV